MELYEAYQEVNSLTAELKKELDLCRNSGVQLAKNEAAYRKALRVEILNERVNGTPVTIISDICRGKEEIADLKCARDCSEALYKSSQEKINSIKLQLRLLNDEIQRTWTSGGIQ